MVDRTTKEKQQGNLHVQKLVHNPGALRKSLREENADTTRTQRLLKMLPDAFNFSYEDRSAGDLVKLKFSPNPHFRPPSREAQVFHAMEGEITVDTREKRLAELSGHLIQEVKFGGGLLGHLDKGGQFSVKQEQVERTFAWLNQFRRLRVRYEKRSDIHQAFLLLGCVLICWKFLKRRRV